MLECPALGALEIDPTSSVRAHLAACSSCRLVVELVEERRRGLDARDREVECARFEMLIAAREEGTLGGAAGELLAMHLRECAACTAVAATLVPANERAGQSSLPAVSTASYALGREVARGGMGRILEALDVRIGRPVAVKELLGKAPSLAARFEREARVTARLQHPGIVPIYEIGKWPDGTPFYAMRMVEGRTLRETIAGKPTLDERLALLPALIAAADAVAFAHGKRIIHRDLTPNNVLVGAYGDTVVIDWGLAKDLSDPEDDLAAGPYRDEPAAAANLTSVGAVIGTAAYMPPEQASGAAVDERADVYALGAILYHVLAGASPYRAKASEEVVLQVKAGPPRAIAEVAPGAPRDLVSIVERSMARDPADRYATAAALADELRRFQTGRLVEAHHYSRGERARRWLGAHRAGVLATSAAAIAIAIVGSVGVASTLRQRDVAIAQRTAAEQENVQLMEEQGRQELVAGHTTRSLAWLNAAYQAGDTSAALRFMLGTALHRVESLEHAFDCSAHVESVEVSPDDRDLLVACSDEIVIWRLADGARIRTFSGKTDGATYSHDGGWIASKQWSHLTLWNATTGAQVFTKRAHTERIRTTVFTPDDRTLITTGDDRMIRVWDVATGEMTRAIEAGTEKMNVVRGELAPDGKTFVSTLSDGSIASWDIESGVRLRGFQLPVQSFTQLSHDGTRLAACGTDGTIRIADMATGAVTQSFIGHANAAAFTCEFSRDDRRLVTAGADGLLKVWDVAAGHLMVTSVPQEGLPVPIPAQLSADGERLFTVGSNHALQIWHVATGSLVGAIDDPFGLGDLLVLSHDGHRAITVREPATVVVFRDLDRDASARALPPGHAVADSDSISGTSTSPTGRQLALEDAAKTIHIVDAGTLTPVHHADITRPFAWSGDGTRLAAKARAGGFVVIDAQTGATVAAIAATQYPERLELDAHGRRLLFASSQPVIWDVDRNLSLLALAGATHAQALSTSGARVVAWSDGRALQVWDVDRRAIVARLALDADVLDVIGFSSDERRVVVDKREGKTPASMGMPISQLAAFDTGTGALLYAESGRLITSLDPSHRWIATYGIDKHVEVIDVVTGVTRGDFVPGAAMMIAPQAFPDGELVMDLVDPEAGTAGIAIRGVRDGRVLAVLHVEFELTFTQDSYESSARGADISSDGRTIVTNGPHPVVWTLPREERSPAEVDRIVRDRIRWRISDGKLLPVEAKVTGRVTRGGGPVDGADVALQFENIDYHAHVATDADGRFSFDLRSGAYTLSATSPDGRARGEQKVQLGRDDVEVELELIGSDGDR